MCVAVDNWELRQLHFQAGTPLRLGCTTILFGIVVVSLLKYAKIKRYVDKR